MWNDVDPGDEAPEQGCQWPIIEPAPCDTDTTPDDETVEWTGQMAIEILWAASGRQFGVCKTTYRPCRVGCELAATVDAWGLVGERGSGFLRWDPWGGSVFARIGCGCTGVCSCTSLEEMQLWHKRVRQVTEVTIDGVVLDPSSYRLSRNRLIRVDGEVWPSCQDWTVAADQPGAWTVTLVHGRPVPYGGRVSAGILQAELGKAVCGDEDCELPRRVQTVSRAGVTVGFVDPMQFLDEGKTGLYEVDLWLQSVNPGKAARRARIYRVDDPRRLSRGRAR